jgi:ABC-type multidrug transport system permease subunit
MASRNTNKKDDWIGRKKKLKNQALTNDYARITIWHIYLFIYLFVAMALFSFNNMVIHYVCHLTQIILNVRLQCTGHVYGKIKPPKSLKI